MKTVTIMQPYIFPYLAYFQLYEAADTFVYLDNVQYRKGGLINRNRILFRGKSRYITFPVKKASIHSNINERFFAENIEKGKNSVLGIIRQSYSYAPYFDSVYPLLENIINTKEINIAEFAEYSQLAIFNYLNMPIDTVRSSQMNLDSSLNGEDRVIEIVKKCGGTRYINPIGGQNLYTLEKFRNADIELRFLKSKAEHYKQFADDFLPNLSIIDVLMFNSKPEVIRLLSQFELIEKDCQ